MIRVMIAIGCVAMLTACAAPGAGVGGLSGPSPADLARLAAPEAPPAYEAKTAAEARLAGSRAAEAAVRIAAEPGPRRVEVAAAPWIRASPEGAAFLAAAFPRALARGAPPASCPAAAASPPAPDAATAAEAALTACLAQLERRGAEPECGCRVVAADGALLAPLESFAFAPAVSAFLIGPEGARRLVAEALKPMGRAEIVSFRDLTGEKARAALVDESAEFAFLDAPEARWRGERQPFGWRRGRLAERLSLIGPAGERLTLLIGVEARDVSAE